MKVGEKKIAVMANVFVRKRGEPWPHQRKTVKSFSWCQEHLKFRPDDLQYDVANRNDLPCLDNDGGCVYIELDEGEARRYEGWEAGVYLIPKLSLTEFDRILNSVD